MKCAKCGNELDSGKAGPIASMSASVMGDEYIVSYYFCPGCNVYTEKSWRDVFTTGEDEISGRPLSKAEGDTKIAIIQRCSKPWDKRCECEAHIEFFGLDSWSRRL